MAEKACDGGRVFEAGDMAECPECGTRVRWDLQDHPFWGFQHCPDKTPALDAVGLWDALNTDGSTRERESSSS